MNFSKDAYVRDVISSGEKNIFTEQVGVFAPFISVDNQRYKEIREKTSPFSIRDFEKRTANMMVDKTRGAIGLTLKYAQSFFPAYKFYISEFLNDEWLAAVDWHKGFHRDHVIHQPYVAYIGMTLLHDKGEIFGSSVLCGKSLLDKCIDTILEQRHCEYLMEYLKEMGAPSIYWNYENHGQLTRELWKWMFVDTFFMAALFHDIGYPWKFINAIHGKLDPHAPLENPAQKNAKQIAVSYGDRLVFYPLNNYRKKSPSTPADWQSRFNELVQKGLAETHGMPGAISFLHLNDLLAKYPAKTASPARRFCVEWAAMAILMHDMSGIYSKIDDRFGSLSMKVNNPQLRVSFLRDPLSFVLTLSDLIEDFGRPNARFVKTRSQNDNDKVEIVYYSKCSSVDVECDKQGRMKIKYKFNNKADVAQKRIQFIPKETLQYFDPIEGYLDYRGSGIKSVKLLAEFENNNN